MSAHAFEVIYDPLRDPTNAILSLGPGKRVSRGGREEWIGLRAIGRGLA
jgi:hypothetical protein